MAAGELSPYDGEWWHFDAPDADVHRPIINVPVS
jgi:D-alanyl-D-alanine dipeptidase